GVRPEPLEELLLSERPRPVLDEQPEELESLGRQTHRFRPAPDLVALRVKGALTESDAHFRHSRKTRQNRRERSRPRGLSRATFPIAEKPPGEFPAMRSSAGGAHGRAAAETFPGRMRPSR